MGPQKHGRVPRQELQKVYNVAVTLLRQWDLERLEGRDPVIVKSLERVKNFFKLKDPP